MKKMNNSQIAAQARSFRIYGVSSSGQHCYELCKIGRRWCVTEDGSVLQKFGGEPMYWATNASSAMSLAKKVAGYSDEEE